MATTKRRMRLRKAEAHPEHSCPHPEKNPYTSDIEAYAVALKRSKLSGRPLRVYPCYTEDGKLHYHLTKRVNRVDTPKGAAA